jgi:putative hemolysin
LVIALITYLSLILGELVPKRLALSRPEGIAKLVALPMQTLSRLFRPVVAFLDWSTERLFVLIPFTATDGGGVTEEEIEALLSEGAAAGVIEHEEQQMMHKVLRLADRPASAIMTPRTKVRWLDLDRSDAALLQGIAATPYSFFPVGAGSLDRIAGILSMKDLATHLIASPGKPIRDILRPVVQIPEGISALQVLDRLRSERSEVALVIDEYGSTTGIVSIHDLLEAIVGDLPSLTEPPPTTTLRADGSLLVDGAMDIHELFRLLKLPRSSLSRVQSHSVAGFIMEELKRVARTGDRIEFHRAHFEVVDMDGQRIDKALATPPDSHAPTEET